MSQETETVNGTPETPQTAAEEPQKETGSESQPSDGQDSQPVVQEEACILKSSVAEITETFLQNEKDSSISESASQPEPTSEPAPVETQVTAEPEEPVSEEVAAPPQVIEVSLYTETETVAEVAAPEDETVQNGHSEEEAVPEPLTNGNGVSEVEEKPVENGENGLNGTIASELITEDYKLPDVVEVKKNFEYSEPTTQTTVTAPPKKVSFCGNLFCCIKHFMRQINR